MAETLTPACADDSPSDRRALPEAPTAMSPERLLVHQVETARHQLAEARNRLIAARRRVTQLEDAVRNWEEMATALLAQRHPGIGR